MKNRGIIVISSLVVIGGGVAYLLWKLSKNKEEKILKDEEAAKAAAASSGGSAGGGGGSTGSGTKPTFTFPFKSEMEGNLFRVYVRFRDKPFADSIKLDATGKLNSTLQKAWDKYGGDYLKDPTTDKPKVDNPLVPKKGNTLDEVAANLKANGYTVSTFTNRVSGYLNLGRAGGSVMASFDKDGAFRSMYHTYWDGTQKNNSGKWEDSGNIIKLKSGRILNEGIKANLSALFTLSDT